MGHDVRSAEITIGKNADPSISLNHIIKQKHLRYVVNVDLLCDQYCQLFSWSRLVSFKSGLTTNTNGVVLLASKSQKVTFYSRTGHC
jgi:hypothetical protein